MRALPLPLLGSLAVSVTLVAAAAVASWTQAHAVGWHVRLPPPPMLSTRHAAGLPFHEPMLPVHGVVAAAGPYRVGVVGCDVEIEVGPESTFQLVPPGRACTLRAWTQDGALRDYGPPLALHPDVSRVEGVVLVAPSGPLGGLGIRLDADRHGMGIERVVPDGAAARAGLAPSDRIVSIDGVLTRGMPAEDFIARAVGPVGTEVTLGVRRGDEVAPITLTRLPVR